MRTKYKPKAVEYLNSHFDNQFKIDDEDSILKLKEYVKKGNIFLEIGPGKGQFILNMAQKYPQINFLVCELNPTICGIALKKIDESGLNNVKLIYGNFYKLRDLLSENIFDGLFLNFSDPWPKKRHEKRRLTSDLFLVEYAKVLKEGALIYFKTDNDGLYEYSLEQFIKYKRDILMNSKDYDTSLDEFDAQTEFETRYKNEGVKIKRLILKKTCNTINKVVEETDSL